MKTIITIAALAVAVAGCEYIPFTDANRIERAKAHISILSANPTTVKFIDVKAGPGGTVCGVFNAQEEGYPNPTELTWTGPLQFVTIEGKPVVVNNDSDCLKGVAVYSRCVNDGDKAKIDSDVKACRDYQAEEQRRYDESTADIMRSSGLRATGDTTRDSETIRAYHRAARVDGVNVYDRRDLSASVESGNIFKTEYNRLMRSLPDNASQPQKVGAAASAVTAATAKSEAYLKEQGL